MLSDLFNLFLKWLINRIHIFFKQFGGGFYWVIALEKCIIIRSHLWILIAQSIYLFIAGGDHAFQSFEEWLAIVLDRWLLRRRYNVFQIQLVSKHVCLLTQLNLLLELAYACLHLTPHRMSLLVQLFCLAGYSLFHILNNLQSHLAQFKFHTICKRGNSIFKNVNRLSVFRRPVPCKRLFYFCEVSLAHLLMQIDLKFSESTVIIMNSCPWIISFLSCHHFFKINLGFFFHLFS